MSTTITGGVKFRDGYNKAVADIIQFLARSYDNNKTSTLEVLGTIREIERLSLPNEKNGNYHLVLHKEVVVPRGILENIFVTAVEGGSNYWYFLSDEAISIIRKAVPKEEDPYLSTAIFKAFFDKGAVIPINDAEDEEEVLGYLDIDKAQSRLQALSEDVGLKWALENELEEIGDATSSDVVFQYLAFGEVVFS